VPALQPYINRNPSGSSLESSYPNEKQTNRSAVTVPACPPGWSPRSSSRFWCLAALCNLRPLVLGELVEDAIGELTLWGVISPIV
jgi:hypothetical protein